MKTISLSILLALSFVALADAPDYERASNAGTSLSRVTFLPKSGTRPPFNLVSYDVTSDKAGSLLKWIIASDTRVIAGQVSTAAVTIALSTTSGLTAANIILKKQFSPVSILATITNWSGTNAILNVANGTNFEAGDLLYVLQTNTTPVGAATVRQSGESLFIAPNGPLMIELDGTSAVSINNAVVK